MSALSLVNWGEMHQNVRNKRIKMSESETRKESLHRNLKGKNDCLCCPHSSSSSSIALPLRVLTKVEHVKKQQKSGKTFPLVNTNTCFCFTPSVLYIFFIYWINCHFAITKESKLVYISAFRFSPCNGLFTSQHRVLFQIAFMRKYTLN